MNRRLVGFGLSGVVVVGLLTLFGESLAAVVPADAAADALGSDYLVVAAAGGLGAILSAALVLSGRPGNVDEATTPNPERAVSVPVPGDGFDAAMTDRTALLPVVGSVDRSALRDRLRTAAVVRLMRTENCSRTEAKRRIDRGTWTGDPAARLFLSSKGRIGARLRAVGGAWIRLRPWWQVGAYRTVVALLAASDEVSRS